MGKKRRHRMWWFPFYQDEERDLIRTGKIPVGSPLFDKKEQAYAYAYANRFEPLIENGVHVTDENGYAKLVNHGRINLIGIPGKKLDWTKIKVIPADGVEGEVVETKYEIPIHHTIFKIVLGENEEVYKRHVTSPLAKAGGVVYDGKDEGKTINYPFAQALPFTP